MDTGYPLLMDEYWMNTENLVLMDGYCFLDKVKNGYWILLLGYN